MENGDYLEKKWLVIHCASFAVNMHCKNTLETLHLNVVIVHAFAICPFMVKVDVDSVWSIFSRLHFNLRQINFAQFIFSLSFGCLWLRNRTRRGKTVFPGVCLCRLGCVYACSCLVCFPVWALHGHKVWSHNSPLSRLPSTLPVMSEFTEIRTQGKQTAAATALGRRVGPSRRDPSTDGGCGW